VNEQSVERARPMYTRARKLFRRAWGYCRSGLDLSVPGLGKSFESGTKEERARLLALVKKDDVALLYWCGAALGSMVSVSKEEMKIVGELPKVEELMSRGLQLDETYDEGSIHEFFITYDAARGVGQGGGPQKAREHMKRALELSKNKKLGPLVAYAESVTVEAQDKKEFLRLLKEVTTFDVDSDVEHRLTNVIAQRRARWLISRVNELFAE
jgi:hypothetical protein